MTATPSAMSVRSWRTSTGTYSRAAYSGIPRMTGRHNGKLRLMYEANPLGFVAEQAGGTASSGRERILDIQPEALHQRVPLMLGPVDVVENTVSVLQSAAHYNKEMA